MQNNLFNLNRQINWDALKNVSNISPDVKNHLVNVYTTLALSILMAALGSVVSIKTQFGGGLTFFVGIGAIFWLSMVPKHEVNKRLAILSLFSFIQGVSLGPLIDSVIDIDPSIVTSAFLGTTCIFLCFTASAIFAERRSYLFLGGLLSSALSMLLVLNLMNIFFRSIAVFNIQLYGGLLLFCGFVIFDTQLIIEKASNGSKDFVWDSLELFLDFLNIFVRLLIILSKDKKKKSNNNRR